MVVKNRNLIKKLISELNYDTAYSISALYNQYEKLYDTATSTSNLNATQLLNRLADRDEDDSKLGLQSFRRSISRQCLDKQELESQWHKYFKPSLNMMYHDMVTLKHGILLDKGTNAPGNSLEMLKQNHEVHRLLSAINNYLKNSLGNNTIGFFSGETALLLLRRSIDGPSLLRLGTIDITTNEQTAKRVRTKKYIFSVNGQNSTLRIRLHCPRKVPETQNCIEINENNCLVLQILELISSLKTSDLQQEDIVEKINKYICSNDVEFADYLHLFPNLTKYKIETFGIKIPT